MSASESGVSVITVSYLTSRHRSICGRGLKHTPRCKNTDILISPNVLTNINQAESL